MTAYDSAVLTDTPLAYYECAESSGTTLTDSSGNSHNGSWNTSGVTLASAGPGDGSTSALLDGTAGFGSVALNLSTSNQLTFEAWIYQYTFSSSGDNLAAEFDSPYFSNNGSFLVDMNFGSVTNTIAYGSHGSGGSNVSTIPQPTAAAWHHYVFYLDLTTTEPLGCYVDGVSQTETQDLGAAGGGDFASSTLYIGARSGTSLFNQMRVAKVAVYNGFLSPTRITAHFGAMPSSTDLTVSVSDSSTTGDTVTASIPGTTLAINVSDSTTTNDTALDVLVDNTRALNVSDSVTTGDSGSVVIANQPDLNASVSDSTTTSEWVVIASDPPITFTLEVNVADNCTTADTTTNSTQLGDIAVTDSTTTGDTVSIAVVQGSLAISVTDSTTTGEQIVIASLPLSVLVTDNVTSSDFATVHIYASSNTVWLPTEVASKSRFAQATTKARDTTFVLNPQETEVERNG